MLAASNVRLKLTTATTIYIYGDGTTATHPPTASYLAEAEVVWVEADERWAVRRDVNDEQSTVEPENDPNPAWPIPVSDRMTRQRVRLSPPRIKQPRRESASVRRNRKGRIE